jgi:hypothetical protein
MLTLHSALISILNMPSLIPALAASDTLMTFLNDPEVFAMMRDPAVANFAVGNPQEPPLPRARRRLP